jgi:hypothetical protein
VGWLVDRLVDWLVAPSVGWMEDQTQMERELEASWQDLVKQDLVPVAPLLHNMALEAW